MKKEMHSGSVQNFKSLAQFEAQEGKLTAHTFVGKKVYLFTKDGTYRMTRKSWDKLHAPPPERGTTK